MARHSFITINLKQFPFVSNILEILINRKKSKSLVTLRKISYCSCCPVTLLLQSNLSLNKQILWVKRRTSMFSFLWLFFHFFRFWAQDPVTKICRGHRNDSFNGVFVSHLHFSSHKARNLIFYIGLGTIYQYKLAWEENLWKRGTYIFIFSSKSFFSEYFKLRMYIFLLSTR